MKIKTTPKAILIASISLMLAVSGNYSVRASSVWSNAGTDWNTAANWSAGVPNNTGYVVIQTNPVDQPNISASNVTTSLIIRNFTATAGYDITAANGATLTLGGGYNVGDNSPYAYVIVENTSNNTIAAPIAVDSGALGAFSQDANGGTLALSGVISASTATNTDTTSNSTTGQSGTGEIAFYAKTGGVVAVTGANTFTNAVVAEGGGTVQVNTIGNAGYTSALGESGTINVNGAVLNYVGAGETTTKTFNLTGNNTIDTTGATGPLIISTPISTPGGGVLTLTGANSGNQIAQIVDGTGPSSVTKTGAGSWTLAGANTYTGATTISNGTLIVASGASTGSLSSVSLGAATLAGAGTIGGLVTASGASGASNITAASTSTIGNLTLNGGVTSANGLTLNIGIDGAGATNSSITLGAGMAVTGTLTVNLYDEGTNSLSIGTPYNIVTGSVGSISDSSLAVNLLNSGNYILNSAYGTNGIAISGDTMSFELSPIPEPTVLEALSLGFGLLMIMRRRSGSFYIRRS